MKSWFSFSGVREEIRKISWPKRGEMTKNTTIVLGFVAFFVVYFILTEFVLVAAMRWLGIGA